MIGLTSFLLAVTVVQARSDNLAATATLIAPATCIMSAKDPAGVTIRVDPTDGSTAKSPVAGSLFIVIGTIPHITQYGYNDGAYPVRGVPISGDAGTSYTFTFKAPIRRIADESGNLPGRPITPPPIQPIFALSHEVRGWLRLELFVPRVTGSGRPSGIDVNATNTMQIGHGVYRIGPCRFEP